MELLLFLLAIPILLFLIKKHRKNEVLNPTLPGPPRLPVIGNLHQLDTSALHRYLYQLSKTYGPLMSLQLGFMPVLVVSSAKMAEEVLKTQDRVFSGRHPFFGGQKLSRNGLDLVFAPYGDYYREMRKICNLHLFSSKRVQSFRSIREDEVSQMIKKISKLGLECKLTNLSEIMLSVTSAIICRITFGWRYDDAGCGRTKLQSLLHDVQAVAGGFFFSDYFPHMGWVDRITGQSNWVDKTCKELDMFLQEAIDEHLDHGNRGEDDQEDFTDVLLHLQNDHSFSIDLNLDHIKSVLMDIFVAGTDTSAATVVWAMTELMRNPTVMNKLQEEVRNIIGENDGVIDENDIQKLAYLKAVVKEVMRLHPPAPLMVPHETTQKCNVVGYEIQPKTVVYINAWAIGRDPDSWKNPEEFFPERFLGSTLDFYGQDFELIPFGAGRRGCPGIHLGVGMVELALANLVYHFNWELPSGVKKEDIDMEVRPGITMHKKNELCLVAKKYSECMNV